MPNYQNLEQVYGDLPTLEQVEVLFALMFTVIEMGVGVEPYAYGMPIVHVSRLCRHIVESANNGEDVLTLVMRVHDGAIVLDPYNER